MYVLFSLLLLLFDPSKSFDLSRELVKKLMQMSLFIDGITDSLFDGFIDRREKSSME
jgi:hypothetical protein